MSIYLYKKVNKLKIEEFKTIEMYWECKKKMGKNGKEIRNIALVNVFRKLATSTGKMIDFVGESNCF